MSKRIFNLVLSVALILGLFGSALAPSKAYAAGKNVSDYVESSNDSAIVICNTLSDFRDAIDTTATPFLYAELDNNGETSLYKIHAKENGTVMLFASVVQNGGLYGFTHLYTYSNAEATTARNYWSMKKNYFDNDEKIDAGESDIALIPVDKDSNVFFMMDAPNASIVTIYAAFIPAEDVINIKSIECGSNDTVNVTVENPYADKIEVNGADSYIKATQYLEKGSALYKYNGILNND
jgi:hypothetical protein